jgi:uncharacterized membrane protein YdjX (TVP38/TMEM64 family)
VLDLLSCIEAQGALGPLLFMLVMALVVVLLVPGVMFTAGAGFAFGVIEGSVVVVLGTTLGATLAFLLARYGFGRCAEVFLGRHERLRAISNDLGEAGWKVVLMTRMVPFCPFKLSNYAFGLTRVSLRGFVCGTLVGEIPLSVHNVYLGAIAADLATLGQRSGEQTALAWLLYALGFFLVAASVVYLGARARRALARHVAADRNRRDADALA